MFKTNRNCSYCNFKTNQFCISRILYSPILFYIELYEIVLYSIILQLNGNGAEPEFYFCVGWHARLAQRFTLALEPDVDADPLVRRILRTLAALMMIALGPTMQLYIADSFKDDFSASLYVVTCYCFLLALNRCIFGFHFSVAYCRCCSCLTAIFLLRMMQIDIYMYPLHLLVLRT
jgi:hypothetical protein